MRNLRIPTLCACALMSALTALGAFISIPIPPYPVPLTLQTFFVFMAGMLLPPRAAFYSQAAYVLLGLVGVPVFTGGGGPSYVFHPTFGYLLGFLCAAPLVSAARERLLPRRKGLFALCAAGTVVGMELLGVAYMALIAGVYAGAPLPLARAWYLFYIFLPLDLVKFAVCAPLCMRIARRLPARFRPL